MKRFTETDKWRDAWFSELDAAHKLLWLYLLDECDAAGVIDYSQRRARFDTGTDAPIESLMESAGPGRIVMLQCGKLWLVKFCRYQYPRGISETAKMQSKVRESIVRHSLPVGIGIEYPSNTHSIPIGEPFNGSQDKDKVQDKDKDKVQVQDKDFDSFWAAYPRKVGKGQARKSWTRAKRERRLPALSKVMTALDAATNSEQWQDSHLIPHPTTWINRDGWEDEIAEFKKAPQLRGVRPPMVFDPADNVL